MSKYAKKKRLLLQNQGKIWQKKSYKKLEICFSKTRAANLSTRFQATLVPTHANGNLCVKNR